MILSAALFFAFAASYATAHPPSLSTTHTLAYDAIVSPALVKTFFPKDASIDASADIHIDTGSEQSLFPEVPSSLAEYVNTIVAGDILQLYIDQTDPGATYAELDESRRAVSLRCYPRQQGAIAAGAVGRTCTSDHAEEGMDVHISSHLDVVANESGGDDPIITVRFDVTMTAAAEGVPKEVLIRSVPKISAAVQYKSSHGPVWSVRSRLSSLEMAQLWDDSSHVVDEKEGEEAKVVTDDENAAVATIRHNYNTLQEVVLSDNLLRGKMRISSVGLEKASKENTDEADPSNPPPAAEIWQYYEAGHSQYTRALFIDSTLRSLTNMVGTVHAESFVHPSMISHPVTGRILILSESPFALLREVLKYSHLKAVDLVGVHPDVLSMIIKYMPSLNNCSDLRGVPDRCFDHELVNIVSDDAEDWLDEKVAFLQKEGEDLAYDIILVDIPPCGRSKLSNHEHWLSLHFQEKIKKVMNSESVLVINAGSAPSMDVSSRISESPARDRFLYHATRDSSVGGLEYNHVNIYDEPLAHPLDTSFIIAFLDVQSDVYISFYSKEIAAFDLDLTYFLLHSPPNLPTLFYDGPTHIKYSHPSRTWETWYCNTSPWRDLPICTTFLQTWFDETYHHEKTEVSRSQTKGRSLHAAENIPKGHYVLTDDTFLSLRIDSQQWEYLEEFIEVFPDAEMYKQLRDFFLAYGYESEPMGTTGWAASLGSNNTFTNHACSKKDINVGYAEEYFKDADSRSSLYFSPPVSRRPEILGTVTMSYVDIEDGDEIMMDYETFRTNPDESFKKFLSDMCKHGSGLVSMEIDDEHEEDYADDEKNEYDDDER